MGRIRAGMMLGVLLLPLLLPAVAAQSSWRADGWLTVPVVGPHRLDHGDEFACAGMPGRDVFEDTDVIEECRTYLMDNIAASRWGEAPLSFGLNGPDGLEAEGEALATALAAVQEAGFEVIGDADYGAHGAGFTNIIRAGGSLEKNIASIEMIEAAAADEYVNLYWEARIEDLNVRKDGDVLGWVEGQPFWFTTWGEYHTQSLATFELVESNATHLVVEVGASPTSWSMPLSFSLESAASSVSFENGTEMPSFTLSNRSLDVGHRTTANMTYVSAFPGSRIIIETNVSQTPTPANFNGLTPFMATGHQTDDLFEWSSPFQDSSIRFTWLILPQARPLPSIILPFLAIILIIAIPVAIHLTVKKDRDSRDSTN